jgi:predicted lipoprotein with Yx(FWY)xxD motif
MPNRSKFLIIGPILAMAALAGCSSAGASTAPTQAPAVTQAPASVAPASEAPSAAGSAAPSASAAAAGGATVEAKSIGSFGTGLVAGSNGMTVYTFAKDVKDSGKSNCNTGCINIWPALTVASGAAPSAGAGVSGKLGTITRDDGSTQVTYNGLPLYFFSNDHAPGDTNGIYQDWEAVKP